MVQEPTEVDRGSVEQALKTILASTAFRSSKQCSLLLRYIVTHSLANQDDLLRERVIGAEVFGRPPDYDTGNDPIVRSRAGEVRKRLAQFYADHGAELDVLIAIPSGSYRAVTSPTRHSSNLVQEAAPVTTGIPPVSLQPVERIDMSPVPETLPTRTGHAPPRRLPVYPVLLTALLVIGVMAGFLLHARNNRQPDALFQQFWAPLITPTKPVVVYIGANYAYRLAPTYLDAYRVQHGLQNTGPEFFVDLKPSENLTSRDLLPTNNLIGFGDVAATAKIVSTLTTLRKSYDLRYGDDIGVTDLRSTPVLLIGGFSNPWTTKLTSGLRYTLAHGDSILDRKTGKAAFKTNDLNDYAVVSRVPRPETGGFVIAIAGVGTSANQAAADFISDPKRLAVLLQTLASGWENRNVQLVLHTDVINDVPVSVDVKDVSIE